MSSLSRREFLKFAGVTLAATALKPIPPEEHGLGRPIGFGRVTSYSVWSYDNPQPGALRVKAYYRDDVLPIYETVSAEGLAPYNPIWNLTNHGWVYSSWIQPVQRLINPVVKDVPSTGFWAEVSVPYTEMRSDPNDLGHRWYRIYYGSVHLVTAQVVDALGQSWYQLKDDQYLTRQEFVPAEFLRPIPPEEMTPISPDVMDKRLEVNLKAQMLYAYQNGSQVFSAQCATGTTFTIEDQGFVDFRTAAGSYSVVRKRPSRHMMGFLGRPDQYDLPGVPFCTYFTAEGAAVHGTYWHNDFGHPRSHGCVNVPPAVAKWVYRWTLPSAPYADAVLEVKSGGTPIIIS
jgi:L,D-transpeptidase catalytic domain/TAT (twin-arginine translocation) pathway signal sequence